MPVPRTIRRGDTGAEVSLLQTKLALPLQQLGTFDAYTEAAVKRYQQARGLKVDGIVGAKTWTALGVTNYTAPAPTQPRGGGSIFDYFPTIPAGGGGTSTGGNVPAPTAPAIAPGSRVLFTGNVLNVLGGRAILVAQSALDRLSAELMKRGYQDATADSTYSEVQLYATLSVGKNSTGQMAQDLVSAGNAASTPIGNARAEVVGAPGTTPDGNGNKPKGKDDNTLLIVGAVVLVAALVLRPR